jgi:hypothetical protein
MEHIFHGDINENEYILTQVKQIPTKSIMTKQQLDAITDYLAKAVHHDDQHIITINDQLPIRLTNEEANKLLSEIEEIQRQIT